MERKKLAISTLFWVLSVNPFCLVTSRNLAEVKDEKNYNSPDPNAWSSPRHPHKSPSCQTPPSHGDGGGIHYYPPLTPPYHGGGGGSGIHYSPPPTPFHGGSGGSSGCNCNSPPSITTPSSPHLPLNPPISPTTPTYNPIPPITPPTSIINPSPPLIPVPDPNSPPFPCNYWFSHPSAIWVLFGYWGTVGTVFATPPASGSFLFGRNLSLLEALGNTRDDGYGALLRQGTASLLNSMATTNFYFNTQQVREGFNQAIRSEKMAAAQGILFQKANEGRLKR